MPEPTSTAGAVIVVGSVSIAGTLLGIPYEALLLGLLAGLLSLKGSEDLSRLGAVSKVTASALFAGAGAPVASNAAYVFFGIASTVVQPLCALAIGYGWKPIVCGAWYLAKAKFGGANQ